MTAVDSAESVDSVDSVDSGARAHPEGTTAGAEAKDPTPEPVGSSGPVAAGDVAAEDVAAWTAVCPFDRLQPERGVAALVDGEPVAVFRTHDDRVWALHNVDPFSNASVLSRGIVGDVGGTAVVASPLYKQHFSLADGTCLEDADTVVATYPVRVNEGTVEVGSP